jgi:flagellar hook-associated protein 1
MSSLSIGASALNVDQQVLTLLGQNIANAGTPGYHRQVADLAALTNGTPIGGGVEITQVRRLVNNALESEINQNSFQTSSLSTQLDSLNQVQSFLATGAGSLQDLLNKFFTDLQQLSAQPDDTVQRQAFLSTAANLSQQLNSLDASFQQLRTSVDAQTKQAVSQINALAPQIASLNAAIHQATIQGDPPNNLQDQRDQLINQLSTLVDVRTIPGEFNQVNVIAGGESVVLGSNSSQLQLGFDQSGKVQVTAPGVTTPLSITGGNLGGLLQVRNVTLPDFQSRLNTLTQQLIQKVDGVQATGLGLTGPMTFLAGSRSAASAGVPLAQANLAFPPQAGTLFVSVTNQATGQRTLSRINIDPATQSLQDVANAITGIGNIQAVVDNQTQTLRILAQPGYAFDFAGQLPTAPENVNVSGSATPQISGAYSGSPNDTYTFKVIGSGTVGVTPNLALEVRNGSGTLLDTENIGAGYTAGAALGPINGVNVSLGAGTVNDGDSFTAPVVANPDTSGILAALGLNTFFTGTTANDIQVNPAIVNNPDQLAASRSGQPGDNTNLQRLIAVGDQPVLANGTATLSQFFDSMVADAGSQVQDLTQQQTALQAVGQQLSSQQQSLSGVDPNEELVNLLQFQRAFQLSARYVTVVNDALNSLIGIIQ